MKHHEAFARELAAEATDPAELTAEERRAIERARAATAQLGSIAQRYEQCLLDGDVVGAAAARARLFASMGPHLPPPLRAQLERYYDMLEYIARRRREGAPEAEIGAALEELVAISKASVRQASPRAQAGMLAGIQAAVEDIEALDAAEARGVLSVAGGRA